MQAANKFDECPLLAQLTVLLGRTRPLYIISRLKKDTEHRT